MKIYDIKFTWSSDRLKEAYGVYSNKAYTFNEEFSSVEALKEELENSTQNKLFCIKESKNTNYKENTIQQLLTSAMYWEEREKALSDHCKYF